MAAQTCVQAQHATLSTTVADTILFSGNGSYLAISNKDSSAALYASMPAIDVAGLATPVGAADDTFYIAPGTTKVIKMPFRFRAIAVVGSGNAYGVELW